MIDRIRAAAAALGIAALATAVPAAAHVTVVPAELARGSYAVLTFRCPNERPKAATIRLEVEFPQDHPVVAVKLRPVPGWKATVAMRKLATPIRTQHGEVTEAVATIAWSGGRLEPGEYQDFEVQAGPLPREGDALVFKALQTYEGGEIVRWIEERKPGEPEPARPAPVLRLIEAPR